MSNAVATLDYGSPAPSGAFTRIARRAVHGRLAAIEHGCLVLREGNVRTGFGDPQADLVATLDVRDADFYGAIARRGALGGAEAYLDGHWTSDDLVQVIRVLARNASALVGLDGGLARLARPGLRLLHALRRNTRRGSRRNIAAHYDLGNDFFALFLDETLAYSSGVFAHAGATLEDAQRAKYERAVRALELAPQDHLLEIGTGWGGLAIHAARTTGCRVTSATISREQHALARERIASVGLAGRVEVVLEDYRNLRGRFDKLVSIEMIEAVGHAQLPAFFRACTDRLRAGGRMFLQAITVPERDLEASLRSVDFVKRHVFPGGQLVSVGALCEAIAKAGSDLQLVGLDDITGHYAETLRHWRARFHARIERVAALGLGDRFQRLWDFYLAYCEGGFRERVNNAAQLTFVRPGAEVRA
jgi:cyclopropane-fatty-acyl-phospholipid synthase